MRDDVAQTEIHHVTSRRNKRTRCGVPFGEGADTWVSIQLREVTCEACRKSAYRWVDENKRPKEIAG